MKANKLFALGLAGLAFTACSNENEPIVDNPTFDGNGAVTVKLLNPGVASRAVTAPTPGDDPVAITGTITVSLYESGSTTDPKVITINASDLTPSTELKFWNVTSPGKITVSINEGVASYNITEIKNVQQAPASIPAYGETTKFTLSDQMESPNLNNDAEAEQGKGNKQEQGAEEGDQNKKYQMYTAKVTMAIPVARLEVSGITHKDEAGKACEYSKLTIKGVYMDNLYTKGGVYAENNTAAGTDGFYTSAFANGTVLQDYCWDDATDGLGTGITAVLKEEITTGTAAGENFLEANAEWPKKISEGNETKAQAFAFNFYPAANVDEGDKNLPVFKIYFDTSEGAVSTNPKPAPRFAMISKYLNADGEEIKAFEPGKIYRITKAELKDGNIIGDEGGNTLYGVEVTVKEAVWTPVNINAEWAE